MAREECGKGTSIENGDGGGRKAAPIPQNCHRAIVVREAGKIGGEAMKKKRHRHVDPERAAREQGEAPF